MSITTKVYSDIVDQMGNDHCISLDEVDGEAVAVIGIIILTAQMLRGLADDVDEFNEL